MSKLPILLQKTNIENFCKKYHIVYLALFGSVLTSNFTQKSSVDILVRFEKKHIPHFINLIKIESELSDLIGYPVDLKTPNDLSPYFRDDVLTKAMPFFEE
ncbi:MAG: nucleotidyltransferase domain-containing protein [Chlamydiae bacterium]|nr:nucleotidyltransferase domain-containing protein [Chlamydiota bacterium]